MSKVAQTKITKTKLSKTSKTAVAETVPEPTVEPTVEATTTVTETGVESLETETESLRLRFERLIKTKQEMIAALRAEVQELRKMQRDHELALRDASKRGKTKRRPREDGVPRKPSGFASPVVVSDDLYGFLSQFGVKKGEPIARTDVTRHITSYIKQHDLQNPEARREIQPDAVLKKLFGPAEEHRVPTDTTSPKVYTYLKLQRYLSQHFPKKVVN